VVEPAPAPVAQAPAPPADVRFATRYKTGDQVTESVTYLKGRNERFEVSDMVLLRQPEQKRTVQISRASKTYLVTPEGMPAVSAPSVSPGTPQTAPGVVYVATTIVDTSERKPIFGREARRVKTITDKQPQPGACDPSKLRIETDGWYIDAPAPGAAEHQNDGPSATPSGCKDEVKSTQNGDPKVLGFPIAYTSTIIGDDGKPSVVTMEVTELDVTTLDAALFEIPSGMTAALNVHELSRAVSDANEAKLAAGAPMSGPVAQKKPGTIRVGVPELTNKGTEKVDTRALRTTLIAELAELKVEAIPLAAAPQPELENRAKELSLDYLLMVDITQLKASKPGGLSRVLKATAGEASAKDITEAKLAVQLLPPGGKTRLSTTTDGKDGGIGVKTGLGVAKFAGSMYLRMYTGGMYGSPMGALNMMSVMNMGGMGMFGNPALMGLQSGMGGGGIRTGMALDATAGAASFLMQQAMMGTTPVQQGTSFDASLGEALENAAKKVAETLTSKK
jgi:hypothetical protein